MDEVDNIIIETLRALNCDIQDDINSLRQFDENLVVLSVSTCLEAIIPSSKFPKKLPPSMAVRLKFATHLAEQIKDIGFKDEIGYQTILYFNEVEIRRLLIFLIEKLPRDTENSTQIGEVGYIPKLLTELKLKLNNLYSPKIPSSLLDRGTICRNGSIEVRSYGNSCNLKIKNLKIPTATDNSSLKNYYVHILPSVTKQCSPQQLIPSLLYQDCKFSRKGKDMLSYLKSIPVIRSVNYVETKSVVSENNSENNIEIQKLKPVKEDTPVEEKTLQQDTINSCTEQLKMEEDEYKELQNIVDTKETLYLKLNKTKERATERLQDAKNRLNVKNKTMAILSREENLEKLKLLIEKANIRLVELANQWNEVQGPLLEEYKYLQSSVLEKKSVLYEKEKKLKEAVSTYEELLNDLKEKVDLEEKLVERLKNNIKSTNRHVYTKNIMEIIGNIKKQNNEMQKILLDTKDVQKDINSLTGQIDRSFTISDELIFSNAKRDEISRNAYKLLVSLHNECGEIVKILSDIGLLERESRNLQELYDNETTKETAIKLKRLNEDLQQVREENMNLMKQVQ